MNPSKQSMLGRLSRSGLTAALVASALLTACTTRRPITVEPTPSFVFRSLDLSQRTDDGNRDWDLSSPEARYDLSSRTIRARRPEGVLYRDDQPHYRITADLATVLRDGELVVLEGSVQLRQLNQRGLTIEGDNLIWTPSQSRMVINQRPTANDGQTQIRSRELAFQQDTEVLVFSGPTQLNRVDETSAASTVVRGGSGTWNLKSGLMQAPGPVEAVRSDGRTLNASGLDGNTRKGYLDLQQPVMLVLEGERGRITAGRTRWLFSAKQLLSDQPVQADLKNSKVQGGGFKLDESTGTVIISRDCRVEQKSETLTARRCAWNWRSERVVADGDVVLQRTKPAQITRASRMEAKLSDDGEIRFGQSGARVESRIKLSPAAQEKPRRPQVSF
ncbi:LPS export ABC transporter periplasmic protein LptC [Synechococcus sp. YX-04-1]|uniref:LPS export ABC transporter periplasmic protein LptC n=1 Tax=Synechococcus sp. YX-04-1 TaxID=3062778 RepID=UPI0026E31427|nr:LPS export ABC transporter periplasmic protein LptC [Synechococcus sp. YX-04-1]MDO6351758.1 LPS export ABC transporter periplasmic protein LptC [Synechococcus sp. YX-04-1]